MNKPASYKSYVFIAPLILFLSAVVFVCSCKKQGAPDNNTSTNPPTDTAHQPTTFKSYIVYTNPEPDITVNGTSAGYSYLLDLNNDGVTDFVLSLSYDSLQCDSLIGTDYLLTISPDAGNAVAGTDSLPNEMYGDEHIDSSTLSWFGAQDQIIAHVRTFHSIQPVNPNPPVSPHPPRRPGRGVGMSYREKVQVGILGANCSNIITGNWTGNDNQIQYVGLKLTTGGNIYYGWVGISLNIINGSFAVYDYAYNKEYGHLILPDQIF